MLQNPLHFLDEDLPEQCRQLSAFAHRYGHPEFIDTVSSESATTEDLLAFWAAVAPLRDVIHKWLDSLPRDGNWPDGAAAYLYMLQALAYAEPESRAREDQRRHFWDSAIYPNLVKKALTAAESEFRSRNYAGVIALLEPYEVDLPKVAKAKLALARKKTAELSKDED